MRDEYQRLTRFLEAIRGKTDFEPKVALVLGSGLGHFADDVDVVATVNYSEIDGFPVSTAPGHFGRFVFGKIQDVPIVIMQGRVHYYEGYAMRDVVAPIRLLKMMGANVLFLTNAAGSVDLSFAVGDFMVLTDHISPLVPSPLIGDNIDQLGCRFSDMTEVYDKKLRDIIHTAAKKYGVTTREGVYLQTSGPNFETPSEIAMYRTWGASAVGMSTACEAMAANHMAMQICGVSCITNLGAGISGEKLSSEEVGETAARVAQQFKAIVKQSIIDIGEIL